MPEPGNTTLHGILLYCLGQRVLYWTRAGGVFDREGRHGHQSAAGDLRGDPAPSAAGPSCGTGAHQGGQVVAGGAHNATSRRRYSCAGQPRGLRAVRASLLQPMCAASKALFGARQRLRPCWGRSACQCGPLILLTLLAPCPSIFLLVFSILGSQFFNASIFDPLFTQPSHRPTSTNTHACTALNSVQLVWLCVLWQYMYRMYFWLTSV